MIDIHCHLLPEIDDGPRSWAESLEMAELALAAGTTAIVATPHQLGNYHHNGPQQIRAGVVRLRQELALAGLNLQVFAGADVRIEPDLTARIQADEVLTLADRRCHVLLELPHELYFPLEPLLGQLKSIGVTGILSHPERNRGILDDASCLPSLRNAGCLMQVTASSLVGGFGPASQQLAETMLRSGWIDVLASDGHGVSRRRPRLDAAFRRVAELTDESTARRLCIENPARICQGEVVPTHRSPHPGKRRAWLSLARRT